MNRSIRNTRIYLILVGMILLMAISAVAAPRKVVIGSDDRNKVGTTTAAPYKWVCLIKGSNWHTGTGFLVGPDTVVTAAHVIYDRDAKAFYQDLKIYPGASNGNHPYGSATIKKTFLLESYKTCSNTEKVKYDVAVLKLNTALGNTTGYFQMKAVPKNNTIYTATITGYPGEKIVNHNAVMYTGSGSVSNVNSDGIALYTVDTTDGQSGAPVYIQENEKYYVIAVHSGAKTVNQNRGRAITSYIYNWISSKI